MLSVKGHALEPAQVPGPVLAAIATAMTAPPVLDSQSFYPYNPFTCFKCKFSGLASAKLAWI